MINDSTWVNGVGEIHTQKSKDGKTLRFILATKDFEMSFKNPIRTQRYSENLERMLEKKIINEDEFEKRMKLDISKKGTISYVLNIPPQKDFGAGPEIPVYKGHKNGILEVRQDEKESIYILAKTDFTVKKGEKIFLFDVVEDIRNSTKIPDADKDARCDKYLISGTDIRWLLYRGNQKVSDVTTEEVPF
jgi:hypothetical protein